MPQHLLNYDSDKSKLFFRQLPLMDPTGLPCQTMALRKQTAKGCYLKSYPFMFFAGCLSGPLEEFVSVIKLGQRIVSFLSFLRAHSTNYNFRYWKSMFVAYNSTGGCWWQGMKSFRPWRACCVIRVRLRHWSCRLVQNTTQGKAQNMVS